jgi:hypothetical protein
LKREATRLVLRENNFVGEAAANGQIGDPAVRHQIEYLVAEKEREFRLWGK